MFDFASPEWKHIVVIYSLYGAIATFIWVCATRLEEVLNKNLKTKLVKWLSSSGTRTERNWADVIVYIHDRLLAPNGPKKYRLGISFKRSVLSSLFFLILFIVLISQIYENFFIEAGKLEGSIFMYFIEDVYDSEDGFFGIEDVQFWGFLIGLLVILFNLIPDYFSLIVSRKILAKIQKSEKKLHQAGLLFLDFVLTFGIFLIPLVILGMMLNYVLGGLLGSPEPTLKEIMTLELDYFTFWVEAVAPIFPSFFGGVENIVSWDRDIEPGNFVFVVVFLTTFATSLWVWLYLVAGNLLKAIHFTLKGRRFIGYVFDVEKQPVKSLAMSMNGVLFVGFTVAAFSY